MDMKDAVELVCRAAARHAEGMMMGSNERSQHELAIERVRAAFQSVEALMEVVVTSPKVY